MWRCGAVMEEGEGTYATGTLPLYCRCEQSSMPTGQLTRGLEGHRQGRGQWRPRQACCGMARVVSDARAVNPWGLGGPSSNSNTVVCVALRALQGASGGTSSRGRLPWPRPAPPTLTLMMTTPCTAARVGARVTETQTTRHPVDQTATAASSAAAAAAAAVTMTREGAATTMMVMGRGGRLPLWRPLRRPTAAAAAAVEGLLQPPPPPPHVPLRTRRRWSK